MHLHYQQHLKSPSADWLVFFHGMGGDCSIFSKQVSFFQEHFNLLLIDLPGHGRSAGLGGHEPVEYSARRIIELLEELRLPAAHFMGVSLGTGVMQHISLSRPDLIKSMVLAGAVRRVRPWGERLMRLSLAFPFRQLLPIRWCYLLFAHLVLPRRNHQKSRDMFIQAARGLRDADYHAWGFALARTIGDTYVRLARRKNVLPKLYVCGSQDYMCLPSVRDFVKREARAELVVLPRCGHVCNIEQASRFNGLALSFLQRYASAAPAPGHPLDRADVAAPRSEPRHP